VVQRNLAFALLLTFSNPLVEAKETCEKKKGGKKGKKGSSDVRIFFTFFHVLEGRQSGRGKNLKEGRKEGMHHNLLCLPRKR